MTILLIDDERSFTDKREAVVVRTVDAALAHIEANPNVDELWLDFILGIDSITDVLFALKRNQYNTGATVITANKVFYHSSSTTGYSIVAQLCGDLGLPVPEIVDNRTVMFTDPNRYL